MKKEMLINAQQGECRIAIVTDGAMTELYTERTSNLSQVGNIYKGRVTNIEPSIQAAFVDFGKAKNGFLHISDVHPDYFPDAKKSSEPVDRRRSHRERPPIQACLRRGQEVVVQMTKEGIGTKGPTMTTYLSIPGRLLVMMPGMSRLGVSRKIEDEDARQRARKIISEVKVPENMGFIVRTAGAGKSKRDIQRDLNYLLRLWKSVTGRIKSASAPAEIYQESDLVIRTIRDIYSSEITRIICDTPAVEKRVTDFLNVAMPRSKHTVELYDGTDGLFHDHGIEEEIERTYSRHVELPSGGSIVIDQTEALVAIDVNSGRNRRHSNAETTALRTNQEAVEEIARQLRLRDLGGLVVVDFIDMREQKNRRTIDRCFREAVKPDRAKTKLLRINAFGLMEMTRQRLGPSLKSSVYKTCEACDGTGVIKSAESQALQVLRTLQRACAEQEVAHVHVRVTPGVAHHLNNCQRSLIAAMEADANKAVVIEADPSLVGEECVVKRTNARGSQLVSPPKPSRKGRKAKAPRGKKSPRGEAEEAAEARAASRDDSTPDEAPGEESADEAPAPEPGEGQKKPRRRGRRGGRGRKRSKAAGKNVPGDSPRAEGQAEQGKVPADLPKADTPSGESPSAPAETGDKAAGDQPKPKPKRRRRKRATKKTARKADKKTADKDDSTPADGQDDNGTS